MLGYAKPQPNLQAGLPHMAMSDMEMESHFPTALEPFRYQIELAIKPYLQVVRQESECIKLTDSKLGGFPYLPYTLTYPCDQNQIPLLFIAQINFAQTPPLENYPRQGILQFFVSSIWHQECTVRYFPTPEPECDLVDEENLKCLMETNALGRLANNPIKRPGKLQFVFAQAPPNMTNIYFDRFFGNSEWVKDPTLYRIYNHWIYAICHHHTLGGYGYFPQRDPRFHTTDDPGFSEFELLLQIHSDQENFELSWGDGQEICFFIRPQDLKNLDFSRIRFYLCP
jgi:uncharacterized protein YwqG